MSKQGKSLTEWQEERVADVNKQIMQATELSHLVDVARTMWACYEQLWFIHACAPKLSQQLKKLKAERPSRLILAVDLKAVVYLSYYRSKEKETSAPMGQQFVDYLKNLKDAMAKQGPIDHMQILFADEAETGSWRYGAHPDWKKERKPAEPEFLEGLQKIREKIDKQGLTRVAIDSFEADDVLASISLTYNAMGDTVLIVSNDRDLYQTLGVYTSTWWAGSCYGRDQLKKDHGLDPRQWVDWLCLTGKNDLPKPNRVADKTADKILVTFGSYLNAIDNMGQVEKQFGEMITESLREFYYTWAVVRTLHTLRRTLEVPLL